MKYTLFDIETVLDEKLARSCNWEPQDTFKVPPPALCRVVAAAWRDVFFRKEDVTLHPIQSSCWGFVPSSEFLVLNDVLEALTPDEGELPTLVSWGGRRFDIPVIETRILQFSLRASEDGATSYADFPVSRWGAMRRVRHDRYKYNCPGSHLDLCDYLSLQGAGIRQSLDVVSKLVGGHGKCDWPSSEVGNKWKEGKYQEVEDHCKLDVESLTDVFIAALRANLDGRIPTILDHT